MNATIVVLEDDDVLRELLREVLHDEGHSVIAAESLAALPPAALKQVDLIISDLFFNFEPIGLHAVGRLRQTLHRHVPVVLCTAAKKEVDQLRPEIERLGARVLLKPFTIDELVETVAHTLRHSEPGVGVAPLRPAYA